MKKNSVGRNASSLGTMSISTSMISPPAASSFKHVAHVSVNKQGLFEASRDIDPSLKTMLADMQLHSVSDHSFENRESVAGYWNGAPVDMAVASPSTSDVRIDVQRSYGESQRLLYFV